jgi:hypothetical protein
MVGGIETAVRANLGMFADSYVSPIKHYGIVVDEYILT